MDKTALVSVDIETGRKVLSALDAGGVKVAVALWAVLAEYEDWRLVISARQLSSRDLRDSYRQVNDCLAAVGITPDKKPPILILPMNDLFIKKLREFFGKTESVEGMRLGGQSIGNRFLEDAYVYRIS